MTASVSSPSKRRLPVLQLEDRLSGKASPALETRLRALEPGALATTKALLVACEVATETVRSCVAPSVHDTLVELLESVADLARRRSSARVPPSLRSQLATIDDAARRATVEAVRKARGRSPAPDTVTLLDPHADSVVLRHVALAATHACTSVQIVVDAVEAPRALVGLPLQAAGAVAYRNCALGLARDAKFRRLVCEHAELEQEQAPIAELSTGAVAIQLFHEYVGARWKDHCDAQRFEVERRLEEALQALPT